MTDDIRQIEMPPGASAIGRLESNSRETSEMLAPLSVFLFIMVITCTLTLLICWAYDTVGHQIEAGGSRSAVLEFPVQLHKRRFPGSSCRARPTRRQTHRNRSNYQRGAARSLSSKRKFRPLSKNRIIRLP